MKKLFFPILLLLTMGTTTFTKDASLESPVDKVLRMTKGHGVEFGHFLFFDILGNMKKLVFPLNKLEGALEDGVFFDGSSILGLSDINKSDLCLFADLDNIHLSPWSTKYGENAYFFTSMYDIDGMPYASDPRNVLKGIVEDAKAKGITLCAGVELEFFLFMKNPQGQLIPCDTDGYCDAQIDIRINGFQEALLYALTHMGLNPEKVHHEVARGQHEVVLGYTDPVTMADRVHLAKHVIKSFALQNGLVATFMPKPISGINGTGMHIHASARKDNRNLFYDKDKQAYLSDEARSFISGLLKRVPEMNILFNSVVNSSKRLVPGYEAPVYLCCGEKNRSTAIRVPEINKAILERTNGSSVRIELRWPDPECNPYLAFAALFAAGLEGIENKETHMPLLKENLYHANHEELEARGIKTLPSTLGEALELFKSSEFTKQLLGKQLHTNFTTIKEAEWNEYCATEANDPLVITRWELNKGIDGLS